MSGAENASLGGSTLEASAQLPMVQAIIDSSSYSFDLPTQQGSRNKGNSQDQAVRCLVPQSCLTLCDSMDCSLPGSSVEFPREEYWVDCHFFFQGIFPTQGSKSPALGGGFFTTEPPGKPKLSLLQGIKGERSTSYP